MDCVYLSASTSTPGSEQLALVVITFRYNAMATRVQIFPASTIQSLFANAPTASPAVATPMLVTRLD